jgi:hypothetical protein
MRKRTSTIIAGIVAIILACIFIWQMSGIDPRTLPAGDGLESRSSAEGYSYEKTGLSFSHEKGYSVRLMSEQGIDVIVLQSKSDASRGLQISVLPFDGDPSELSFQKIQADIPDMVIGKTQAGVLPFGSDALSFESGEGSLRTREVWFIKSGYLYQMSAPILSSNLIEPLIGTMKFK